MRLMLRNFWWWWVIGRVWTLKIILGSSLAHASRCTDRLLESAYEQCLVHELGLLHLPFERQKLIGIDYKGLRVESGYRADFIVAKSLLVELKSVDQLAAIHDAQVLTYLKLARLRVGLLVNFNVSVLKHGLRRLTR